MKLTLQKIMFLNILILEMPFMEDIAITLEIAMVIEEAIIKITIGINIERITIIEAIWGMIIEKVTEVGLLIHQTTL